MKNKEKYRTKSKEIWYETKRQRKERKRRYPLGFRQHQRLVENLTWIIILLIFVIGLILLFIWSV